MRSLYNILFTIFFVLSAPYYFFRLWRRGGWVDGFSQRFGKYDGKLKQAFTNRHVLWLHAVSVGEVGLCTQLIKALEPALPNIKFVVSTTTSTGMAQLRKTLPAHITPIYYPIDRRRYVHRAMSYIHPDAVVLVEAEIWPNFLWNCQKRGIPYFLVNARVSPRSASRYGLFGSLFRPLFAGFSGVTAQNQSDARALEKIGVRPEVIRVVGSLKFDTAKVPERRVLDPVALLGQLGVRSGDLVLVAGSTHSGEEAILADLLLRLRQRFPSLFLVLVPRHQERGAEVGRILEERKVRFVFRTEIRPETSRNPGELHCLLVNTTGELRYFYERADVVFVGKSLTAEGGQNPIEPAALGKAVVFGPHMENFQAIAPEFVRRNGAAQVRDAAELETKIAFLLENPAARSELGRNARRVVEENQGSLERTIAMILDAIPEEIR